MKKKRIDRHKSGFLVRLPEEYREAIQELKADEDRTIAAIVRRALDAYLKASGRTPPNLEK